MILCPFCGVESFNYAHLCDPKKALYEADPPYTPYQSVAPTFVISGYRMQTATAPPKGLYE